MWTRKTRTGANAGQGTMVRDASMMWTSVPVTRAEMGPSAPTTSTRSYAPAP